MIPTTLLRAQLFVDEHSEELVRGAVALAVLSLVGAGWIAVTPETMRATERTGVQTVGADVHSSAVVATNDSVWERGTRLTNRSTYFLDVSPTLGLRAVTTVPAGQPVAVNDSLVLAIVASRDGEAFYTERTVLHSGNHTVSNGNVASTTAVNVSRLGERLGELRNEFGSVPELSIEVRYRAEYDTGEYRGELTTRSPLVVGQNAYWLGSDLSAEREHSRTRTTVTRSTNTSLLVGLGGLAVLGLGSAAFVWLYSRRELDRDDLLLELHSRQMSEWISQGEIPIFLSAEYIRLDSLRDIVDIGIDNNKRVVHDKRRGIYAVLDDDVVYYYSKDTSWETLPELEIENGDPTSPGESSGETTAPEQQENFGFGELDADFSEETGQEHDE